MLLELLDMASPIMMGFDLGPFLRIRVAEPVVPGLDRELTSVNLRKSYSLLSSICFVMMPPFCNSVLPPART